MKELNHLHDFFGLEFGLVGWRGVLDGRGIRGGGQDWWRGKRRLGWKGGEKGMNKSGKDLRERNVFGKWKEGKREKSFKNGRAAFFRNSEQEGKIGHYRRLQIGSLDRMDDVFAQDAKQMLIEQQDSLFVKFRQRPHIRYRCAMVPLG